LSFLINLMKKFRWQLIIILITGLIVGILLLIQQGNPGLPGDSTPMPVSGGIYTEAILGQFLRLNPFLDIYNSPDRDVDSLIFSGLVKFDSQGLPQPDLAESWGISQDGTLFNFSLREEIFWHDGAPITTEDVLFTVGLLQSGNALIPEDLSQFWDEIQVNVLSEKLIQFALPEAFSPFLDYLTFGILPEHLLGGLSLDEMIDDPYNLAPVGSGPFKFGRLLIEENKIVGVVLQANESYYEGRPFLDEIVFRYYPTEEAAWQAYQDGEVEGISSVSNGILPSVLAEPDLSLYAARKPLLTIVFLNLQNPAVGIFQEAGFRRALLMSIDRQRIINTLYQGQAIQAHGPIMPGNWAYYDEIDQILYEPEVAKRELALLGITSNEDGTGLVTTEGLDISFNLLCPDTELHRNMATRIQADWARIGIDVQINVKPYEDVIADLEARDYEAALVDINLTGSPDPDPYPFWGQAQAQTGQNYAQWDDRAASEFLEQARISINFADRERLYRNFQVVFQNELPSLPLLYPIYNYAINVQIKGVRIGPIYENSDRFMTVNSWYILAERSDQDVNVPGTTPYLSDDE